MEFVKEPFGISTNRELLDINFIHQSLRQTYWAEAIPLDIVKKSLIHSLCFGLYKQQQQVGFARVITDYATTAYLADVFIDPAYRGRGLSKWLMEVIMSHPELQGMRTWQLATSDAHGLYAKFGFAASDKPENIMRKVVTDIYKNMP